MRRKSESTSAAKREAHDRADAAMPDVAGLTVKQAEMALAEARNRERERREYERRKAKGKPLSKITQDAIRYEKCFESGVVKVEKYNRCEFSPAYISTKSIIEFEEA